MKKITLLCATFIAFNFTNAQSTVYSDDFNDEDISDWTTYDEDDDGFEWSVVQIVDGDTGEDVGTPQLRSASWNGTVGPLTPNNYIVSPMLDLSSASGTIMLNWQVKASDADFDDENYSVYVATGNAVSDLLASTTTFDETTLDGVNTLSDRSLDISAFAGESTVYFAFRHYNVSDEFTMEIDNVAVTATTLSIDEFTSNNFKHFYNSDSKLLSLESSVALTNVEVFNILGQTLVNKPLSQTSETIDLSTFEDGMLLVRAKINGSNQNI